MLLAEHAVLGHVLGQERAHGGLGFAVGDGDRAQVGLVVDRDLGAEVAGRDGARGVGEAMGQSDQLGGNRSGHAVVLRSYFGSGGGLSFMVRR